MLTNKESKMKDCKTNWVTAVLFMLTLWCTWNSVKLFGWADEALLIANSARDSVGIIQVELENTSAEILKLTNKYKALEEKMNLDVLPFGEAFNKLHDIYGEGHVFDWRDKLYTTNLKGEEMPWQQQ